MHEIPTLEAIPEFVPLLRAAAAHLGRRVREQGAQIYWLKADLEPPFLEHLSFRFQNQLFFVRVVDVERRVDGPGKLEGLMSIAAGCQGHPCILTLRHTSSGWKPERSGWGLVHAMDDSSIDPPGLVTDDLVEMTDWELHDFAVQIVRQRLVDEGRKIMSSQGNPGVDPSLWFVGDDGPEWVVVRAVRYPEIDAPRPGNWARVADNCARLLSRRGHFASVAVAGATQELGGAIIPLWRGKRMRVEYPGLTPKN